MRDIALVDKELHDVMFIDITVPRNDRVKGKKMSRNLRYASCLKTKLPNYGEMRKVCMILVEIGALGVFTKDFRTFIERLEVLAKLEVIQEIALLGTARIVLSFDELKRVSLHGTFGYLL